MLVQARAKDDIFIIGSKLSERHKLMLAPLTIHVNRRGLAVPLDDEVTAGFARRFKRLIDDLRCRVRAHEQKDVVLERNRHVLYPAIDSPTPARASMNSTADATFKW